MDAKQLYDAVVVTLSKTGTVGLLVAAGDAKEKVPWEQASPKTRSLFEQLTANLTDRGRAA